MNENIKEINVHIEIGEFREIMDIYWSKVSQFNEVISKLNMPGFVS